MESNLTDDQRKQRVLKKAGMLKWGVGLVGVLVLAPVVWALAYAMLGAVALGAASFLALIIGLAVVNLAPVAAMKFANWKINLIVAEAQRNPIPTLLQEYERSQQELEDFSQAIIDYATEIGNVEDQARKLHGYLQEADIASFQSDIDAMKTDLSLQEQDLDEARQKLKDFSTEIKRADAIWKLNMAVSKANAKNLARAEETMARIKKETALDAVTSAMNKSKAQLRERIRTRTAVSTPRLADSSGTTDVLFRDASPTERVTAKSPVFAMPYGKDKR